MASDVLFNMTRDVPQPVVDMMEEEDEEQTLNDMQASVAQVDTTTLPPPQVQVQKIETAHEKTTDDMKVDVNIDERKMDEKTMDDGKSAQPSKKRKYGRNLAEAMKKQKVAETKERDEGKGKEEHDKGKERDDDETEDESEGEAKERKNTETEHAENKQTETESAEDKERETTKVPSERTAKYRLDVDLKNNYIDRPKRWKTTWCPETIFRISLEGSHVGQICVGKDTFGRVLRFNMNKAVEKKFPEEIVVKNNTTNLKLARRIHRLVSKGLTARACTEMDPRTRTKAQYLILAFGKTVQEDADDLPAFLKREEEARKSKLASFEAMKRAHHYKQTLIEQLEKKNGSCSFSGTSTFSLVRAEMSLHEHSLKRWAEIQERVMREAFLKFLYSNDCSFDPDKFL